MLVPKFTIGKERLFVTDKYLCNGHWLVTKDAAKSPIAPKSFKPLLTCISGTYYDGLAGGLSQETTPDVTQAIPKRDGYELLEADPVAVEFSNCDNIGAYIYQGKGFRIGVAPQYVPLLRMGFCFAKEERAPILILAGNTLNDELVGIVMPMRLNKDGAQ
jgi:hypothetical protein